MTDLEDNGTFEDHQHERGEERIVPVLVQAPQSHTEHLKDEEWGHGMLSEQLGELGNGDVTFVVSISRLEVIKGGNSLTGFGVFGRVR